jgi:hypothetical protein
LTDDDGGTDTDSTTTTITNVAPVVTIDKLPAGNRSPEGTLIDLAAVVDDPGTLDTFSYHWTVMVTGNGQTIADGFGSSFSFTPVDNVTGGAGDATYAVTLTVTDDDGGTDTITETISIYNVLPTIALSGAASINEGSTYTLTLGAVTDPGADTVTNYIVFWGDATFNIYTTAGAKTHYYDDNAAVTDIIRVTLVDEDGSYASAGTLARTVNNVAPTATLLNGGAVNEGSNGLVLMINQNDVSAADRAAGYTYSYDFNNDGDFTDPGEIIGTTASGATVPGMYLGNDPSKTIRVEIRDKDGGVTSCTTTITVNNVAPVLNAGADRTTFVGSLLTQTCTITDPGDEAFWTVEVDYDYDGVTFTADDTFTTTTRTFNLTHTFATIGTYTVMVHASDDHAMSADAFDVTVSADTLRVVNFVRNASGFDIAFNRALSTGILNIYDGLEDGPEAADLTLMRNGLGVAGSMTWDAATNTLSFVKTGGVLADGNYSLTLRSDADAFQDVSGSLLDGDSNGVAGGNYVAAFTVSSSGQRVVYLPDFARGAGQPVDVPATNTGLTIRIDSATNVTGVDVDVQFDPSLLRITGADLAAGLPGNWSIVANMDDADHGIVRFSVYGQTALTGTEVGLVTLTAKVPDTAPYGASQVIRLVNVKVNEDQIASLADFALQKAVYFGDATGNAGFSGLDATLIGQVRVGLATGFDASDWTDPVIIADSSGNGSLGAQDASNVAQKSIFMVVPEIPNIPAGVTPIQLTGPDPEVSIATGYIGNRGDTITVPITIGDAAGLLGANLSVSYNTAQLDLANVDIVKGSLFDSTWSMAVNVLDGSGIAYLVFWTSGGAHAAGAGTMAEMNFHVRSDAPAGTNALNLEGELNEAKLVITPIDGDLTVIVDATAPRVTGVRVGSTAWSASFMTALGSDGYLVPTGGHQLDALPWNNINKVSISFSEDVVVSQGDLKIYGVNVTEYGFSDFSYNVGTHTATWGLNAQITTADKLLVVLSDSITDLVSNALDGEWADGSSTYPSGNGTAGGDFLFRMNVLPGDASQNGIVQANDWNAIRLALLSVPGDAAYSVLKDINGNGQIQANDWNFSRSRLLDTLPAGNPVIPTPMAAAALPVMQVDAVVVNPEPKLSVPQLMVNSEITTALPVVRKIDVLAASVKYDLAAAAPVNGSAELGAAKQVIRIPVGSLTVARAPEAEVIATAGPMRVTESSGISNGLELVDRPFDLLGDMSPLGKLNLLLATK